MTLCDCTWVSPPTASAAEARQRPAALVAAGPNAKQARLSWAPNGSPRPARDRLQAAPRGPEPPPHCTPDLLGWGVGGGGRGDSRSSTDKEQCRGAERDRRRDGGRGGRRGRGRRRRMRSGASAARSPRTAPPSSLGRPCRLWCRWHGTEPRAAPTPGEKVGGARPMRP